MGDLKTKLLAAATMRQDVVEVGGELVTVREVGALEFAEYGKLLKTDRLNATAGLIAGCVIDADGNPLLSIEEARQVARSARLSMPIVKRVMELSGFGDDEKESDAS